MVSFGGYSAAEGESPRKTGKEEGIGSSMCDWSKSGEETGTVTLSHLEKGIWGMEGDAETKQVGRCRRGEEVRRRTDLTSGFLKKHRKAE